MMKGLTMKLRNMNAREMRKIAALGVEDVEKEYAFANGIVEGIPVENVNSEFANAVLDEF